MGWGRATCRGAGDPAGLSALPLLPLALVLRDESPALAAPASRALCNPGAVLTAECSSYLRWPRVPPRHPDCRSWATWAPTPQLAREAPGGAGPPRDVQCSPAPSRLWGPRCRGCTRQSTGVGAGPGPGAVCRERARARSQAAPGETIARAAGERGEAISRTAGALHGVRGLPAPARTARPRPPAAAAAPNSFVAGAGRAGRREPGPPPCLPPSLSSSRLRTVFGVGPRTPGPAVPLPASRWSLLSGLEPFALRSGESKPDHPIGRDPGWAFSYWFEEFLFIIMHARDARKNYHLDGGGAGGEAVLALFSPVCPGAVLQPEGGRRSRGASKPIKIGRKL